MTSGRCPRSPPRPHRLFDQLTRALEIARQPRRKSEVHPCCYSSIKRKLFFNLVVALPIVSSYRRLEVPTRLNQLSRERRSKTNNPLADTGLGQSPLRLPPLEESAPAICRAERMSPCSRLQRNWPKSAGNRSAGSSAPVARSPVRSNAALVSSAAKPFDHKTA